VAQLGNIFTFIQYGTYDICPGPVFRCEFNGGVHFVIGLTIFGNFFVLYVYICFIHHFFSVNSVVTVIMSFGNYIFKIYDMVITRHCFSMWIQLWQWLCHPETRFWKYMIWSSPCVVFQCEFSCDSDCVLWKLYFENIWHSHHQALFFSVNSVVTVIMSSGDYILKIYSMVITRHHFPFHIYWLYSWYHLKL